MISRVIRPNTFKRLQCINWYPYARRRAPQTHYTVLQVDRTASQEQIKESYIQLVKKYHPDLTQRAPEHIRKINEAYKVLSDPTERQKYDNSLEWDEVSTQGNASRSSQNQPFEQEQPYDQEPPQKISFGRSLLTMFLMGMVLTTVMMMVFGVPKDNRGQQQIVSQPPQMRSNNYSKQDFNNDFQQSLANAQSQQRQY